MPTSPLPQFLEQKAKHTYHFQKRKIVENNATKADFEKRS